MANAADPLLSQEWNTLQNNIEQYEKGALLIKLSGVVLCALGLMLTQPAILTGLLVAVLWLQEGIFRTFQARLAERILRIEKLIKQDAPANDTAATAFQLHSEWLAGRPGLAGLIKEYAVSALRPTVAFPYVVLLAIQSVYSIVNGA